MITGRIISAFYKTNKGALPKIFMSLRTPEGEKVFPDPVTASHRPFCYCSDIDKPVIEEAMMLFGDLKPSDYTFTETDLEIGIGEGKAWKIEFWEPWRVGIIRKWFKERMGIELFEADIPYIRRLRIEDNIKAGVAIIDGKMYPYDGPLSSPRSLYIDIECDDSKGFPETAGEYAVLAIGTVDDTGKENYYTWEFGKSTEVSMFEDFFKDASQYDYLVVWNKDFESTHLPKRSRALGLWQEWRIFRWVDLAEYFRMFNLESHYEQLPRAYARTLKKFRSKMEKKGVVKYEKIERLSGYYKAWKNEPKRMEEVNMSHAYALYAMESAMEVIKLYSEVADELGIFVDSTTLNSHMVDTLGLRMLRNAQKRWVVPSSRRYQGKKKGFRGAVVFPSKRGVHPFVFLFDFTSLYNRIIQSYYLDPIAYDKWGGTFTVEGVDEYIKFAKLFGELYGVEVEGVGRLPIFPAILHQMEKRRNLLKAARQKRAKEVQETGEDYKEDSLWQMYEQQQKATKVILLACYGVLGMSSSRWEVEKDIPEGMILYIEKGEEDKIDFRVPNVAKEKFVGMVTHIARLALTDTKEFFDADENVEVIYGDTDSNFVQPLGLVDMNKSYKDLDIEDMALLVNFGHEYGRKLEEFYKGRFESGIEMKLEKIFDRGVFGKAKKQYYCRVIWDEDSGWQKDADGNLTWFEYTKGLPLVRTDRTPFLKTYQKKTLQIMLDEPVDLIPVWTNLTKEFFKNKYDHELILRKGVKKRLDDYENISPVVRAAKKLVERGGTFRLGEKVAYLIIDVNKGKPVAEPIDENLEPIDAVRQYPPLTKKALNYYWKRRIWKNIRPFIELVLTEKQIVRLELAKEGKTPIDQWLSQP